LITRWLVSALLCGVFLLGAAAAARAEGNDRQVALDRLLAALKVAPSEQDASLLEAHIVDMWLHGGSPAVTLLVGRGMRDLKAGVSQEAVEDFNSALALDPNLAEAYHRRAIARYGLGDVAGAVRDIEEALRREPRDFAALQTLSHIAEERRDWKGAYAAWKKVLELDPKTAGGEERLRDLRRRAFGEET
jgi:tetratricopeptide (TPR) repeat protein